MMWCFRGSGLQQPEPDDWTGSFLSRDPTIWDLLVNLTARCKTSPKFCPGPTPSILFQTLALPLLHFAITKLHVHNSHLSITLLTTRSLRPRHA